MDGVNQRTVLAWGDDWSEGRVAFSGETLNASGVVGLLHRRAHVGMELEPHESFLAVVTDGRGPQPLMVATTRHAEVIELLCSDGETVRQGQSLAVIEERDPTFDEYDALLSKYHRAASELRTLKYQLRTVGGAIGAARTLRRERRAKPS
jgi:hypothetical protein